VPSVDGIHQDRVKLNGEIPSAMKPPSGCVFHTRCVRKIGRICETEQPPLADVGGGHMVRCHIPADQLPRAPERLTVAG
jgi:peptide/nickel transport system ATP-binding protein